MTYIPYLGTFFFSRYPTVWPWPVINKSGDEPRKQDTQANKRSPLLSEEVPYQITLIRKHSSKCTYIKIKRGTNHRNKTRRQTRGHPT